jgi:opacity protein-like surface antigen
MTTVRSIFSLVPAILAFSALPAVAGTELDLKSLKKTDAEEQSKYGPYVGIFGGQSTGQEAGMTIDYIGRSLDYDVSDTNGKFLMGFEIGHSWKTRRFLEFGLEFEGFFSDTDLQTFANGGSGDGTAVQLSDVYQAAADMNFAAFMLNGVVNLDLRKLRPRVGTFISNLRPYVGAGVGGAQVWFRNQRVVTVGDSFGVPTSAASSPFGLDQFVFAYQAFAGLEYQLKEKFSLYAEYRWLRMEQVDVLDEFRTEYFIGGLRFRY